MPSQEELVVYRSAMRIPYRWAAGMTATRFYREIAENGKLFGTRCPACARVLVPARKSCSRCFRDTTEWVEVSRQGTVKTFTIVHYTSPVQPSPPPIIYILVQLDGADTAFIHRLASVATETIKIGMRVEAVLAENPKGQILDIEHFRPLTADKEA
jgi:hypothetical protein